jgi:hypothetical protein
MSHYVRWVRQASSWNGCYQHCALRAAQCVESSVTRAELFGSVITVPRGVFMRIVGVLLGAALLSSSRAQAQVSPALTFGLSVQTPASRYFGSATGVSVGGGLEFGARSWFAVRAELTGAAFLSGIGSEQPDCIAGAPCVERSMASAAVIGSLSARVRAPGIPLYAVGGADYFYAPRTASPGPSTASGLNVGLGVSLSRTRVRELEIRYHDPKRDLGLMKAVVRGGIRIGF